MTAKEIVRTLKPYKQYAKWLVVSGGEPLLQFDFELARHLYSDWRICVETNGTQPLDFDVDHLSFSPKLNGNTFK